MTDLSNRAVNERRNTVLCLIILGVPILLGFASSAVQGWHYVFDDAFITYRYAKNLALGYGITWNPGYAPTEGYTNFLLVVFLAPFIKAGLDPLLVTRVLSYLSAAAISAMLFVVAKRRYACSTPAAAMIAALVLLAPQTRELCLLGLETVIYALFLLVTFHTSINFLHFRRTFDSVLLGALIILTMLLRPEAALIYPVVLVLYFIHRDTKQALEIKPLIPGALVLLTLGGVYLAWKALHFGYLLPNPFYIKAAGDALISRTGSASVSAFIEANALLIALAYAALLYRSPENTDHQQKNRLSTLLGLGFIAIYTVFFMRTDTLMDINGRFMYPLLPILIYLAMPVLAAALTTLESRTNGRTLYVSGIAIACLLTFGARDILKIYDNVKRLNPDSEWQTSSVLMQKEYRIAQQLSAFPGIETTRISFGDSGVIPYYTNSIWLDIVGLNDNVIARTKNKAEAINYFFEFQPDLALMPGEKNFTWITYGHGPLGNIASWSNDPRWDEYEYVGTSKTDGPGFNIEYFVRRSSPHYEALKDYLQAYVVDGWYETLPFHIGTWIPDRKAKPVWVPRTESDE